MRTAKKAMMAMAMVAAAFCTMGDTAQAASPTDKADNTYEVMAYRYAYCAKVFSQGLPAEISEPANLAWGMALFALESGDNSAWLEVVDAAQEAQAAALAAGQSTVAWYSRLAAENAMDAYNAGRMTRMSTFYYLY